MTTARNSKGRFKSQGGVRVPKGWRKKPRPVVRAKDRPLHDAFHALMLDRTIIAWYHDADADEWYAQVNTDSRFYLLADPLVFLARRFVSARSLAIACQPPMGKPYTLRYERMRRAFPLFAQVVADMPVPLRQPTQTRPITQEEALTLFAS